MSSERKHIFPDSARPSCAQVHWAETLRDRLPSHLIHDFGRSSCAQVIWAETLRDRIQRYLSFGGHLCWCPQIRDDCAWKTRRLASTTKPNRVNAFAGLAEAKEESTGVEVQTPGPQEHRASTPSSRGYGGTLRRAIQFAACA